MTSPAPGGVGDEPRWSGLSHQEIHRMVTDGPGAGASAGAERAWRRMADALTGVQQDLAARATALPSGWEGAAADGARTDLSRLADAAGRSAAGARRTADGLAAQARLATELRSRMPAPAEPAPPDVVPSGTALLDDWAAADTSASNGAQRAVELMQRYDEDSRAVAASFAPSEQAERVPSTRPADAGAIPSPSPAVRPVDAVPAVSGGGPAAVGLLPGSRSGGRSSGTGRNGLREAGYQDGGAGQRSGGRLRTAVSGAGPDTTGARPVGRGPVAGPVSRTSGPVPAPSGRDGSRGPGTGSDRDGPRRTQAAPDRSDGPAGSGTPSGNPGRSGTPAGNTARPGTLAGNTARSGTPSGGGRYTGVRAAIDGTGADPRAVQRGDARTAGDRPDRDGGRPSDRDGRHDAPSGTGAVVSAPRTSATDAAPTSGTDPGPDPTRSFPSTTAPGSGPGVDHGSGAGFAPGSGPAPGPGFVPVPGPVPHSGTDPGGGTGPGSGFGPGSGLGPMMPPGPGIGSSGAPRPAAPRPERPPAWWALARQAAADDTPHRRPASDPDGTPDATPDDEEPPGVAPPVLRPADPWRHDG